MPGSCCRGSSPAPTSSCRRIRSGSPAWSILPKPLPNVAILAYAGPLFDRLAPWADQLPATGGSALAPVSHYLGGLATVLGRYDEAELCFAQSAAFCARVGATFFGVRTDLSLGKLLMQRRAPGDVQRACELLTNAQATAATHGYGAVERRATEALGVLN